MEASGSIRRKLIGAAPMNYEFVAIIALSSVILCAWFYLAHVVFTEGAQIRRAKRDAELAALQLSGKDKTRTLDIQA